MKNNENTPSPQLGLLQDYEFEKTPVLAGIVPPGEMIAIRPICENLGIDRKWQQERIQQHKQWSQLGGFANVVAADKKQREMYCLPPAAFQEWIWSLTATENMNKELWEKYKKGLVIYLLMMLKISLDEIERLHGVETRLDLLTADVVEMIEADDEGKDFSKKAKGKFSEVREIKKRILARLSVDPNQLQIPLAI